MIDMPKDIYIFPDPKSIGDMGFTLDLPESTLDGEPYTHYVRADIHEAEITKLRNALDVAEKSLSEIHDRLGAIASIRPTIRKALTTNKQRVKYDRHARQTK